MKQKLGPKQLAWVEALEAHPERQTREQLGRKTPNLDVPYKACCLGEACLVKYRRTKKSVDNPWEHDALNSIYQKNVNAHYLTNNHIDYYGFYDGLGEIKEEYRHRDYLGEADTLARANDNGKTWLEIAKFIRAYPQAVFSKSK